MITLLYCMPSSGGSFVAWVLGDRPNTVVLCDVHGEEGVLPTRADLECGHDVVVKINTSCFASLRDLCERLQPDRVILVERDMDAIKASLERRTRESVRSWKFLGHSSRGRWAKLCRLMKDARRSKLYHEVLNHEDFIGIEPSRSLIDIAKFNHEACPWCRQNRPQRWGFGGIRVDGGPRSMLLYRVVKYYGMLIEDGSCKFTKYLIESGVVPEKRFSNRWFQFGARKTIQAHISDHLIGRPARYLEIGVYEGRSLNWMISHVLTHRKSRAIGVDDWSGEDGLAGEALRVRAQLNLIRHYRKCTLITGDSHEVLQSERIANAVPFNFIMVDGSDDIQHTVTDVKLAWPLVRRGGFLLVDDCMIPGMLDATQAAIDGKYDTLYANRRLCVRKR